LSACGGSGVHVAAEGPSSSTVTPTTSSPPVTVGTFKSLDGKTVGILPPGPHAGAVAASAMPNVPGCHYIKPTFNPLTASRSQLLAHDFGERPAPQVDPNGAAAWDNYTAMYLAGKTWECPGELTPQPAGIHD
jgi:hypothetical protein